MNMNQVRNTLAVVGVVLFLSGLKKTIFGYNHEGIQGGSLLLAGAILIVGVLISASITEKKDKSE